MHYESELMKRAIRMIDRQLSSYFMGYSKSIIHVLDVSVAKKQIARHLKVRGYSVKSIHSVSEISSKCDVIIGFGEIDLVAIEKNQIFRHQDNLVIYMIALESPAGIMNALEMNDSDKISITTQTRLGVRKWYDLFLSKQKRDFINSQYIMKYDRIVIKKQSMRS